MWSTGAKTAVGTAMSTQSRIWFTISSGILNEIYFPDVDTANTSGIGFLVADERGFFSDEQHDAEHAVHWVAPGVPAFQISARCKQGQYLIETEVFTDPARDALLLNVDFQPAAKAKNLHLYLAMNPHVADKGDQNDAWIGRYKDIGMLFAERNGLALAIACSNGFAGMSCGFIGKSDGVTDIRKHKRMTRFYTEALDGNVSLTGEIDWRARNGQFQIAIACGGWSAEAAQQARAALLQDFQSVRQKYVGGWEAAQEGYTDLSTHTDNLDLYRVSIAVMRSHESSAFPARLWRAFPSPGVLTERMTLRVVITSPGRVTWARSSWDCSPVVTQTVPAVRCFTSTARRKPMGTGARICGWTARHTGLPPKWTAPASRF